MEGPKSSELQTPERPVVWISHKDGERCTVCGTELRSGNFIQIARDTGIRCLTCAGFSDLVFLGSGDAALTRRAVAFSSKNAVVVKFSRARKRHERQGVLVEASAIERAEQACDQDAGARQAKRIKRQARDEIADQEYKAEFTVGILKLFPSCPADEAKSIADHACRKYSGRVGRSQAAKDLEPKAMELAVRAHVRHVHTRYDALLAEGLEPREARPMIQGKIEEVLERWRSR
ncbi:MAG TPA: DUF2293 domain-containing protein [Planctomycetota bacterium]|jgi:hypothetical protein|nr:DUF2293 domain-containing protein [Planctomycetota bacterium]